MMAFMVECVYGGMSRKQAMGRKLQQQWNEYRRSAADVSAAMMTTTTGRGGEGNQSMRSFSRMMKRSRMGRGTKIERVDSVGCVWQPTASFVSSSLPSTFTNRRVSATATADADISAMTPAKYNMQRLKDKVESALIDCDILQSPNGSGPIISDIIVSCSGGVDSCALLRTVALIRDDYMCGTVTGKASHDGSPEDDESSCDNLHDSSHAFRIHVLHFNHNTRPESLLEEEFVKQLSGEVGADSFHVRRGDFSKHSTTIHPGANDGFTQASARAWRHRESISLSQQLLNNVFPSATSTPGSCVIMLGHHRDDNVETLLLKLVRGCHVSRMQGMTMVSHDQRGATFVRPMLEVSKDEIIGAMKHAGYSWREDSSNNSTKYRRNKIRHELIPVLQELSGWSLYSRVDDIMRQSSLVQEMLDVYDADPYNPSNSNLTIKGHRTVKDMKPSSLSIEGKHTSATGHEGATMNASQILLSSVRSLELDWWRQQPELVREDQLHRLAISSSGGRAISYEKIKLVSKQLYGNESCHATMQSKKWRWQLTKSTWIVRRGNALYVDEMETDSVTGREIMYQENNCRSSATNIDDDEGDACILHCSTIPYANINADHNGSSNANHSEKIFGGVE